MPMLRFRASEASEAQAAFVEQTTMAAEPSSFDTRAASYPAIDAYVAELRAGLAVASPGLAAGTCEEMRQHLVATADALTELGESAKEAERLALSRFGGIEKHRRALTGELRQSARRVNPQAAFRYALALYGGVCALELLSMFLFALVPQASMESFMPAWRVYCFWILLGSPLLWGCVAGRQIGRFAVRATFRAHLPIIGSLLLASGLAYLAVLGFYLLVKGEEIDPSHHWLVGSIFGFTCYHVVRLPLSLMAAWLTGRPRHRRSLPMVGG